jgi:hypothetical protein
MRDVKVKIMTTNKPTRKTITITPTVHAALKKAAKAHGADIKEMTESLIMTGIARRDRDHDRRVAKRVK